MSLMPTSEGATGGERASASAAASRSAAPCTAAANPAGVSLRSFSFAVAEPPQASVRAASAASRGLERAGKVNLLPLWIARDVPPAAPCNRASLLVTRSGSGKVYPTQRRASDPAASSERQRRGALLRLAQLGGEGADAVRVEPERGGALHDLPRAPQSADVGAPGMRATSGGWTGHPPRGLLARGRATEPRIRVAVPTRTGMPN